MCACVRVCVRACVCVGASGEQREHPQRTWCSLLGLQATDEQVALCDESTSLTTLPSSRRVSYNRIFPSKSPDASRLFIVEYLKQFETLVLLSSRVVFATSTSHIRIV